MGRILREILKKGFKNYLKTIDKVHGVLVGKGVKVIYNVQVGHWA